MSFARGRIVKLAASEAWGPEMRDACTNSVRSKWQQDSVWIHENDKPPIG